MGKPNANEDLSAYLDGELTDAEVAELEAELQRDPELRAELDALEDVVRFLREEGPDMAPMGFHHQVMARIEQEHPERPSLWAWLRRPLGFPLEGWLVGLAAAAVLLLVIPKGSDTGDTSGWTEPPPAEDGHPAAVELPALSTDPAPVEPAPTRGENLPDPSQTKPVVERKPSPEPVAPVASTEKPPTVEPQELQPGTAEETEATGAMAAPGYRYVVRGSDPAMKLALLRLAGRYGGAVDASGQEVADSTMSSNVEDLLVQVAQPELTRFTKELAELGYTLEKQPTSELVAGTTIPVRITLQLVGGGVDDEGGKPNAARKALDFEAEAIGESL